MTHRSVPTLLLTVALALVVPLPALGAVADVPQPASSPTYDTPAPEPGSEDQPTPRPTPRPTPTPAPGSAIPLTPDRDALSIGYAGAGVLPQAPLLVALLAGYFDEVGLERVTVSRSPDVLADVLSGDLDIAVVDKLAAASASAEDPTFRAIAGYSNYPDGAYGGSVLVAAPGLVADEPATVIAFLAAYLRALGDLSTADTAARALELIEGTDLALDPDLASGWTTVVGQFAPFDGGFGALDDEGGLGELTAYLTAAGEAEPDLDAFLAQHALNIAQAWSTLEPNPANPLAGQPGVVDLVVGVPLVEDRADALTTALEAGYFEDAGFASVEVLDVEEPLLGVLQGQLDFGIVDAVDAADGSAQGLPLVALAGHGNYGTDGAYGGDLVVASTDVLAEEGSTVSAFLIAYLRALRDLREDATLAPHDGGFGARDQSGGLGELDGYLQGALGTEPDLETLVQARPLEYAQAWWGLPANPTTTEEAQ
jgi:ABC-type nitrate/sulfonate/bicarbonate transport system substrate-binding protein